MHKIEKSLQLFLEQVCDGKAEVSEDLIEEFGERCKDALRKNFLEKPSTEFNLRMSNIGKPLRQLMLEREHGRPKATPQLKLKMLYGYLYESFMILMLKASGLEVEVFDTPIELDIAGIKVPGTPDVKIDGKLWDIKTASPYSYDMKFASWESLKADDSFGYFAQGFGYATASKIPFAGWLAINKVDGNFKLVEIPPARHKELRTEVMAELEDKITKFIEDDEIPECCGVVDETFRAKPTGNKVLDRNCEWCSFKYVCHPELQFAPEAMSKAKDRKYKFYVELKNKGQEE